MKNFLRRYKKYIFTSAILLYAIMAVLLFYYGELSITGTVFALLPAIAAGIWIMRNYKFTRKVFQCKIDGTTMDIVDIYPLKFWQEPRQRAIRHRYGISSIIPLDNKPHGELYLKGISALIPLYFDTQSPEQALILGVAGGAIPRYRSRIVRQGEAAYPHRKRVSEIRARHAARGQVFGRGTPAAADGSEGGLRRIEYQKSAGAYRDHHGIFRMGSLTKK